MHTLMSKRTIRIRDGGGGDDGSALQLRRAVEQKFNID